MEGQDHELDHPGINIPLWFSLRSNDRCRAAIMIGATFVVVALLALFWAVDQEPSRD